jgi:hypothetical protein
MKGIYNMWTGYANSKKGIIRGAFAVIVVAAVLIGVFFSTKPSKLYESVTVEAGTKTLEVSHFVRNIKTLGTFKTDLAAINMSEPGTYEIEIQAGRRVYSSKLLVEDTIAPTAETVSQEIWAKEEKEAKDFVKNIIDVTDVKVFFKEQPDFSKGGMQEVVVILEDKGGNKSELKASLTVKVDIEPPKINGTQDQTIFIGDAVSYKKDVTVTDNRDESVNLVVDSSAVNLKKAGSYNVIYSATDTAGNTGTNTVTFTIKEKPKKVVDPEELHKLADNILASIIKDGMTQREKAKAIFTWTNKHIDYIDHSDKSDWMKGALQGIKVGAGDCFTYYATARELLTRAGFQNQCVMRIDGTHYWNLVYCDGGWYHFDPSPRRAGHTFVCFLRTDAEVEEYSKQYRNYYNFDKTKYPPTPLK